MPKFCDAQKLRHAPKVMFPAAKVAPVNARPRVPSAIQGTEAATHGEGMLAAAEMAAAAAEAEAADALDD
jgi:hypothetical protein